MLKASKNYQKSENKIILSKDFKKPKFNLQTTVDIAEKEKFEVLYQKPFTLKGLIHSTVRPLLTANRSIY